jgi:uncharacterized protein (DUF4415 family)
MSKKGDAISETRLGNDIPLTAAQRRELSVLAARPEEDVDTSDIPELTEEFWRGARAGRFYRPVKQQLTLRLDADVVDWFRRHAKDGKGYQTDINRVLRAYVEAKDRKAG